MKPYQKDVRIVLQQMHSSLENDNMVNQDIKSTPTGMINRTMSVRLYDLIAILRSNFHFVPNSTMGNLSSKLAALESKAKPIQVGLIGAGKFESML